MIEEKEKKEKGASQKNTKKFVEKVDIFKKIYYRYYGMFRTLGLIRRKR